MAELLLELFSEEIPARMQKGAAEELARRLNESLAPLSPRIETFYGPRRIAAVAEVAAEMPATTRSERGPRFSAPEAAVNGFLRKHGAPRTQLAQEGDYWVLNLASAARPAAELVAAAMPALLRRFAWPKSMRWGGNSAFTWVRPLRRILCLLDGQVVPFDLRDGDDDGHGLASGNLTEGHRFLAPGVIGVDGVAGWRHALAEHRVILEPEVRRAAIAEGIAQLAAAKGLQVVPDEGLLDEVTGLVEWPVPLLGRIDAAYMDLPSEVMQVSMRVNQRYFTLRDADARPAPWFAFVANIAASDSGAAIVAGNERVLRARFSDARHFWDTDRKIALFHRLDALRNVTFHADLGSQYDRARRLEALAREIAALIGGDPDLAARAGLLAKADLTTGMVGEFPELQGVMGGHYARASERPEVAEAIGHQYLPASFSGVLYDNHAAIALAIADRLDTLTGFFGIGERPTGSGDPFALRRAALGIIDYVTTLPLPPISLKRLIEFAANQFNRPAATADVFGFIIDRLRVFLRGRGKRHDVLNAVFSASNRDDLRWLIDRADDLGAFLDQPDGANLLANYRRAANILRIENAKDGPHTDRPEESLFGEEEEKTLYRRTRDIQPLISTLNEGDSQSAMQMLADARPVLDEFFEAVLVNDVVQPARRINRLRLLNFVVETMNQIADFSKIEG